MTNFKVFKLLSVIQSKLCLGLNSLESQAIQALEELQAESLLARNLTSHITAQLEVLRVLFFVFTLQESGNMLTALTFELRRQLSLIIDVLYSTKNDVAEVASEKSVLWNLVKVISIYFHEFSTTIWHILLLFCVYLLTQYFKLRTSRFFFYTGKIEVHTIIIYGKLW